MLSVTATELIVDPSRGQSLRPASVQAVSVISTQIRSIVALALAAPTISTSSPTDIDPGGDIPVLSW